MSVKDPERSRREKIGAVDGDKLKQTIENFHPQISEHDEVEKELIYLGMDKMQAFIFDKLESCRLPIQPIEQIEAVIEKVMKNRNEHLEMFAAAYLKKTNIPPDKAMLVEQRSDNEVRWWFEEKPKDFGLPKEPQALIPDPGEDPDVDGVLKDDGDK